MARRIIYLKDPEVINSLQEVLAYAEIGELENLCEEHGLSYEIMSNKSDKAMLKFMEKEELTGHCYYHICKVRVALSI